ncbi:MAG: 2OG-Fe(II) oxygenase [Candidatus Krumholzibacteriia bacterium]
MTVPVVSSCEVIAGDLDRQGWSVCPGFLGPAEAARLRERVLEWWEEGQFRRARVGRGPSLRLASEVRTDHVRWLDFTVGGRFAELHDTWFEPLRLAINRRLYLGLFDLEAHATVYPPGSSYARHLDRFRDAAHRTVSVVLYLNEDWSVDQGGQLRLHLPSPDGGATMRDILPEAGTLAAFLSGQIWHEVLPATRDRLSLTGWFCTRA